MNGRLTPALEAELGRLREILVIQAKLIGDDLEQNAHKIELLHSILLQANIVENEDELTGFNDLRTAAEALDQLMLKMKNG